MQGRSRQVPLQDAYQQAFLSPAPARDGGKREGWIYLLPPNQSTSCSHANRLHKVSKHVNDSAPKIDVRLIMPFMVMAVALSTMAVAMTVGAMVMTVGAMVMAVVMIMIMSTDTVMVVATKDEQVEYIDTNASKC